MLKPNKDLEFMKEEYEAGRVRPVIDGNYSLEQVQEAFGLFARGEHKGKIVISVIPE